MLAANGFPWDEGLAFAFAFRTFAWKAGLDVTFPTLAFQTENRSLGGVSATFAMFAMFAAFNAGCGLVMGRVFTAFMFSTF